MTFVINMTIEKIHKLEEAMLTTISDQRLNQLKMEIRDLREFLEKIW